MTTIRLATPAQHDRFEELTDRLDPRDVTTALHAATHVNVNGNMERAWDLFSDLHPDLAASVLFRLNRMIDASLRNR